MTFLAYGLGVLAALACSGFFSGAETGVYCLSRVRLNVRAAQGSAQARRLSALMRRPQELVITTLLGTNVAEYVSTACVTTLILHTSDARHLAEVYATAILTPLILVFGAVLPKDWFRREADRLMYPASLPLSWALKLAKATGLVWGLNRLSQALIAWIDPDHADQREPLLPRLQVRRLLAEGAVSGGLSPFQRDTLERVMNISRTRLADVMVPRRRAAIVRADIARADLLRIVRMAHFSRLPVYERDPRRIIGILNVYHVLMDERERPVREYIQPAVRLRSDESVSAALVKLQQSHEVMAIVTDARGQCLGLVTIKDLVEEIVGELEAW